MARFHSCRFHSCGKENSEQTKNIAAPAMNVKRRASDDQVSPLLLKTENTGQVDEVDLRRRARGWSPVNAISLPNRFQPRRGHHSGPDDLRFHRRNILAQQAIVFIPDDSVALTRGL